MSAPAAAAAARITYRQLDYWARQGWIQPSSTEKVGSGRAVRRYAARDVARLEALAHLGRSGVDLASFAHDVGALELDASQALVLGPFGVSGHDPTIHAVGRDQVFQLTTRPGRWVVYDPAPLLAQLSAASAKPDASGSDTRAVRRSA
jgi:DNA-binding transcriptional MerR regulator